MVEERVYGLTAYSLLIVGIVEQTCRSRMNACIHPARLEIRLKRRLTRRIQYYETTSASSTQQGRRDTPSSEFNTNITPSNPARLALVNIFGSLRIHQQTCLVCEWGGRSHSEKTKETLYELACSPRTWMAVGMESCR